MIGTRKREPENQNGLTFNIIRGHRLILWANRIGFRPEFTKLLDKKGVNYVQEIEQIDEDAYTLIVLAKLVDKRTPFSIIFTVTEEQLKILVEPVKLEED